MIREAIIKLSNKENLSYEEAEQVMNEIMEGQASQVQMAAYLTALSIKGGKHRRNYRIRRRNARPLYQAAP